jgi:hypothetical protein
MTERVFPPHWWHGASVGWIGRALLLQPRERLAMRRRCSSTSARGDALAARWLLRASYPSFIRARN